MILLKVYMCIETIMTFIIYKYNTIISSIHAYSKNVQSSLSQANKTGSSANVSFPDKGSLSSKVVLIQLFEEQMEQSMCFTYENCSDEIDSCDFIKSPSFLY